ncbi:hypothetical protein ACF1GW_17545 [Streptomyces achromogenes]|uniref:hypothetical protein n=1 Tax=Streptomyces achromogenes TaxID=67255 RepID=UPI0036FD98C2
MRPKTAVPGTAKRVRERRFRVRGTTSGEPAPAGARTANLSWRHHIRARAAGLPGTTPAFLGAVGEAG